MLSMYEQQIQQIQQQIQAVEKGKIELKSLKIGLGGLVGSKDKEVLAPVGRGIFSETKLTSEKMLVDVGGGNFVKKTIPETQEIIEKQIKKLEEVKIELEENLQKLLEELQITFAEAEKEEKKTKN